MWEVLGGNVKDNNSFLGCEKHGLWTIVGTVSIHQQDNRSLGRSTTEKMVFKPHPKELHIYRSFAGQSIKCSSNFPLHHVLVQGIAIVNNHQW